MKRMLCILLSMGMLCGCGASSTAAADAVSQEPVSYSCRVMDYYDYSAPVPYSEDAEDSYYDNTLFAGDSRMGSLYLYGTHKNAQIEYVTSLNLLLIDTMPLDNHEDGATLMDVLSSTDKKNIYLLFGINEIRNQNFDAFHAQYQDILTMLRQNDPDVNIYIILSYHPRQVSGLSDDQLTAQLQMMNGGLVDLAQNNHVYYLDTDNGLDDDSGKIKEEFVFDGLHFNPEGAHAFEDYIGKHTVRSENYVKEVCE